MARGLPARIAASSRSDTGSAVRSSKPNDFQPISQKGSPSDPRITLRAISEPLGLAYIAVGTKRALASATGLPRRSTSALWMLVLLMPAVNCRVVNSLCYSIRSKVKYCIHHDKVYLRPKKGFLRQILLPFLQ
jgi:hypothetical protein